MQQSRKWRRSVKHGNRYRCIRPSVCHSLV